MSNREIEQQIRSKEIQVERLEAEIREARGYIGGLRRRLSQSSEKTRNPSQAPRATSR